MSKRTYIVSPSLLAEKLEITADGMIADYDDSIKFFNWINGTSNRKVKDYVATFPKGTTAYEKKSVKILKRK